MESDFKFYEVDEIIKLLKNKEKLVYVDDGIDDGRFAGSRMRQLLDIKICQILL